LQKTQLLLEDRLFNDLNNIVKNLNVSISDFISQLLKKEIFKYKQDKKNDILNFIDDLKPLESFKDIETNEYINNIRNKSRIL